MKLLNDGEWWVKQVVHCWLIKTWCTIFLFFSFFLPVPNAFYFMHLHPHVNTKYPEHGTLNEHWWPNSTVAINKNYSKFQTKRWELLSGEKRNICKTGTKSKRRPVGNIKELTNLRPFAVSSFLFYAYFLLRKQSEILIMGSRYDLAADMDSYDGLMWLLAGDVVQLRCRSHAAQEPLMQGASYYVFAVS